MGRKATGPTGIAELPMPKKFREARGLYYDTGYFLEPTSVGSNTWREEDVQEEMELLKVVFILSSCSQSEQRGLYPRQPNRVCGRHSVLWESRNLATICGGAGIGMAKGNGEKWI